MISKEYKWYLLISMGALTCSACSKESGSPAADNTGTTHTHPELTLDDPVGMSFSLDGQEVVINDSTWLGHFAISPGAMPHEHHAQFIFVMPDRTWGVRLGRVPSLNATTDEILSMCQDGPRTFVSDPELENGVQFTIYEENVYVGDWITSCGSAQQTNSSFVIEQMEFVDASPDTIKLLASFRCVLYDCDSTPVRILDNGRLRVNLLRD